MALTLDCRHEVALKCPGGTKAIASGFNRFQPEVSVAHQHDASRREGANDIRPAVAPSGANV